VEKVGMSNTGDSTIRKRRRRRSQKSAVLTTLYLAQDRNNIMTGIS